MSGSVAFLLTPTVIRAVTQPGVVNILWVVLGAMVVVRVAQISVIVSPEWVVIRNFFKTTHVPVWEAEVELGEREAGVALSDAGGKYDEGGRTLYVRRTWHGDLVHVGVAPRFGAESTRIHDELIAEIQKARAI